MEKPGPSAVGRYCFLKIRYLVNQILSLTVKGFFIYKMQLGYTGSCFHPKKLKLLSL